jgi:hypothetical protein
LSGCAELMQGRGAGRAILVENPSGNVIELFEFKD